MVSAFDLMGNVALVRFPRGLNFAEKKKFAKKILKEHSNVKTVLEKSGEFKGRLRKMKTKYVLGEKNKEVLYRENNCVFRFNIDGSYFSSRLSNERREIAEKIKKNDVVLVMFAGVGPFSIAIAKNSPAKKVYSNELNREANRYGGMNINLNKLRGKIELVPGDIKKVAPVLKKKKLKFDVIVMPRPQLKDSFLQQAFMLSRKGTRIYYYDFCKSDEIDGIVEKVKNEAINFKRKIKILKVKKAGELAPYKFRIRLDFVVLK